jgi:hypothetical protein
VSLFNSRREGQFTWKSWQAVPISSPLRHIRYDVLLKRGDFLRLFVWHGRQGTRRVRFMSRWHLYCEILTAVPCPVWRQYLFSLVLLSWVSLRMGPTHLKSAFQLHSGVATVRGTWNTEHGSVVLHRSPQFTNRNQNTENKSVKKKKIFMHLCSPISDSDIFSTNLQKDTVSM